MSGFEQAALLLWPHVLPLWHSSGVLCPPSPSPPPPDSPRGFKQSGGHRQGPVVTQYDKIGGQSYLQVPPPLYKLRKSTKLIRSLCLLWLSLCTACALRAYCARRG